MDKIFEEPLDIQCQTYKIDGGMLETVKTPQGYSVSRLISTDPRMFLKPGMSPGDSFTPPQQEL